jgi:hypothetical protein
LVTSKSEYTHPNAQTEQEFDAERLSHPQFIRGFKRRAAFPADHRAAVAAGEWIGDFHGALRAVEKLRLRRRLRRHQEGM